MPIMALFKGLSIGRKLAVILAILGVVAAIIWGINHWLDGIRESGRNEVRAEWEAELAGREAAKAELQVALSGALTPMFDRLATRIGKIDTSGVEINLKLPQAMAADPRYRDVNCSLTAPVLEQANADRALSTFDKVQP